jgi:hypothetical protein
MLTRLTGPSTRHATQPANRAPAMPHATLTSRRYSSIPLDRQPTVKYACLMHTDQHPGMNATIHRPTFNYCEPLDSGAIALSIKSDGWLSVGLSIIGTSAELRELLIRSLLELDKIEAAERTADAAHTWAPIGDCDATR